MKKEVPTKKFSLKDYIYLSENIKAVDDIKIESIQLLDVFEMRDSDYDVIRGRVMCVRINGGIKLVWFESRDDIIAYAALKMLDERILKGRIFNSLISKLFI